MPIRDVTPVRDGLIERPGASIYYQVFGTSGPWLVLMPTWSIVHTDFWRHQIPHFSKKYRVVTFDGRGNGRSSRPKTADQYSDDLFAGDALAVMDALQIDRAVVMAVSAGAAWQLILAVEHPERVLGTVFIGASLPLGTQHLDRVAALAHFEEVLTDHPEWLKFNRNYWHTDWPSFLQFFFSKCFTEPSSDAEIQHFVSMGLETDGATIALTADAPGLDRAKTEAYARRLSGPSLVIHGDHDAISNVTRGTDLAALSGAELIVMPGAGHEPQSRWPAEVNKMLDTFLEQRVRPT